MGFVTNKKHTEATIMDDGSWQPRIHGTGYFTYDPLHLALPSSEPWFGDDWCMNSLHFGSVNWASPMLPADWYPHRCTSPLKPWIAA